MAKDKFNYFFLRRIKSVNWDYSSRSVVVIVVQTSDLCVAAELIATDAIFVLNVDYACVGLVLFIIISNPNVINTGNVRGQVRAGADHGRKQLFSR